MEQLWPLQLGLLWPATHRLILLGWRCQVLPGTHTGMQDIAGVLQTTGVGASMAIHLCSHMCTGWPCLGSIEWKMMLALGPAASKSSRSRCSSCNMGRRPAQCISKNGQRLRSIRSVTNVACMWTHLVTRGSGMRTALMRLGWHGRLCWLAPGIGIGAVVSDGVVSTSISSAVCTNCRGTGFVSVCDGA